MAAGIGSSGTLTVGSTVGNIGFGRALTGVSSLLTPEQKAGDTAQSFTMTDPQVTLKEGGIVPIAYGEVITSGTMISGVLKVENNVAT
ncbi:hypothetical protein D2T29_20165 [Sinirhodobacter populi]|uniref:Uncharacterized protein n=1 Tax=Paenirhodobacter populi TaxID=2306993 RepID=A0A443K1P9_9RHOB|nr:hypothetical protein [Sinirhodobacter populi]RWR26678.1 hypothetical protein D2T29_20165 [Sinirhodobacter populi]